MLHLLEIFFPSWVIYLIKPLIYKNVNLFLFGKFVGLLCHRIGHEYEDNLYSGFKWRSDELLDYYLSVLQVRFQNIRNIQFCISARNTILQVLSGPELFLFVLNIYHKYITVHTCVWVLHSSALGIIYKSILLLFFCTFVSSC